MIILNYVNTKTKKLFSLAIDDEGDPEWQKHLREAVEVFIKDRESGRFEKR